MLGIWLGWFMSQQGLLAATVDTSPPLREPAGKPSIRAIQVETGPTIDGQLDESGWLQAPAAGPLWQYDPATSEAMSEKTLFRILYDKDYLYIGVWCYDSDPGAINARVMQRDNRSIYSDDYLYMALDTFHDQRNGYIFVVNPNGARYDQIVSNNIFLNSNWDGVFGKQVHPSIRRDGKPNWPSPSNRSALTPRKPPGDSTSVDPSPEKWNEADGPGPSPTSTPTMSARQGISLACGASGKALGLSYRPIYWDGGGIRVIAPMPVQTLARMPATVSPPT